MTNLLHHYKNDFTPDSVYYEVNGQKTHSKFEATIWANGNLNQINFYFMDEIWNNVDWTREPEESIELMMDRRCFQIRSQFDWVCIWYSGGYDSQTVVDYFVKNKLRINELLIYNRDYLEEGTPVHQEQIDETRYATEQALAIKNNFYPDLKITHVTWRKKDLINYYNKHSKDWALRSGAQSTFTKTDRGYLFNFNDQLKHIAHQPNRINIEGREKPRLWIQNGEWHCTTLDMLNEYLINSPCKGFYTSGDMPEMEVKQTWLMINWLESLPFTSIEALENFVHKLQSHQAGVEYYEKWNKSMGRNSVLNPIAYSGGAGKKNWQAGDIRTTRESFALATETQKFEDKVYKNYINNVQDFKRQYPDLFNERNEIIPLWSKRHFVKKVEPGRLYKPEITV